MRRPGCQCPAPDAASGEHGDPGCPYTPRDERGDVVREVELRAARDVLERARHVSIGPMTTTAEIVEAVTRALDEGAAVRLGRLALAARPGDAHVVRFLSSDEEGARSDREAWRTTARVRATWGLAEPEILPRLARAFVQAWLGDWNKGPAPQIKLAEVTP